MKKLFAKIFKIVISTIFILVLSIIFLLFIFVFIKGHKVINFEFLFSYPKGMVLGEEGGIFPAIIGSIYFAGTALLLALFPSLATAIYIHYYVKNKKIKLIFHNIIENIAAIPSIVLGLFSYSFFVYNLGFGRCIFSASTALCIMIMPFMCRKFEKAFDEINSMYIMVASNLGIKNFYIITRLVLPLTFKEIISTMLLGFCFAMGALAPMIFTGAVAFAKLPKSIFEPAMALPLHLYLMIAQGETSLERAYGVAFVELMLLLIFSFISYTLSYHIKKV